ncbi:hypothetical protein A1O3_04040 [Capronia epimyces CBS 606.96]|uniref:Uncharacterized protein n=1 Tax=Capronia epimyces CBS 606.96 TaxID=1182542 RepID=W9Y2P7_9EURO|nr:uncharacterized protein A1O3_04040 [Capronia epimyces CBS 606.96]EXJ87082.1 hypothetical protein A1O3_04040 [Capronia epimyces CBS 606.96]
MPPTRIPVTQLRQGLRTFASRASHQHAAAASRHVPLHHEPSQRILSKVATLHNQTASQFPELVRDATSYTALAALTTGVSWLIYCSDENADLIEFLEL